MAGCRAVLAWRALFYLRIDSQETPSFACCQGITEAGKSLLGEGGGRGSGGGKKETEEACQAGMTPGGWTIGGTLTLGARLRGAEEGTRRRTEEGRKAEGVKKDSHVSYFTVSLQPPEAMKRKGQPFRGGGATEAAKRGATLPLQG